VQELEEKGQTVLVGRTPIRMPGQGEAATCAVDGCLNQATELCEVKVTHQPQNPDHETHRLSLCETHVKGFSTLKWQWRRTPDANSPSLKLDGVYALDALEDT
jgi:hypothetical protein